MIKRKKVFAVIQIGPGTGEYARPSVRAIRSTSKAALAAQAADLERFPHSAEHFTRLIVDADLLTVDGFPHFGVVVHGRTSDDDQFEFHATVLHRGIGAAWAYGNSITELMVMLTFSGMSYTHILRTANDRSPDAAQAIPFLLSVQQELGAGVSANTGELVSEWAQAGDQLHQSWQKISRWWRQWCQDPKLDAISVSRSLLLESDGFVVAYAEQGYAISIWGDQAEAELQARSPDRYGDFFKVVPVRVLRSGFFPQKVAACYQDGTGTFHSAVFRLPLPDTGYDPAVERLRPFQMPIWGKGNSRSQAWLLVVKEIFRETLVHFPQFSPRMFNLPLMALAHEGYGIPNDVRQEIEVWAASVELAQQIYLSGLKAGREEMPR